MCQMNARLSTFPSNAVHVSGRNERKRPCGWTEWTESPEYEPFRWRGMDHSGVRMRAVPASPSHLHFEGRDCKSRTEDLNKKVSSCTASGVDWQSPITKPTS